MRSLSGRARWVLWQFVLAFVVGLATAGLGAEPDELALRPGDTQNEMDSAAGVNVNVETGTCLAPEGQEDSCAPKLPKCEDSELMVMTYNVLHFDSDYSAEWSVRKQFIAKTVLENEPDVLAVQEARIREGDASRDPNGGPENMATDLEQLLPGYKFVRDRAMIFEPGHSEGLVVYYKVATVKLLSHSKITLGHTIDDENNRICQRLKMKLKHTGCRFELFHTHLSYHDITQVINIKLLIRKALLGTPSNGTVMQLLVGDLNTHPHNPTVYDLLTGKSPLSAQERKDKEFSPFTDVWAALHPADSWQDKKGATYSTKRSNTRCDYIMARGNIRPVDVAKAGFPAVHEASPPHVVYPSDHYAVVARLKLGGNSSSTLNNNKDEGACES